MLIDTQMPSNLYMDFKTKVNSNPEMIANVNQVIMLDVERSED